MASYLERFGDVALEISPTSVAIEDRIIIEANRKQDSVSYPLFAEGIHEVVFGRDIPREEVIGFIRLWADACIELIQTSRILTKLFRSRLRLGLMHASVEPSEASVQEGQDEEGDEHSKYMAEVREAVRAISSGESDDSDFGLGKAGQLLNGTGAAPTFGAKQQKQTDCFSRISSY